MSRLLLILSRHHFYESLCKHVSRLCVLNQDNWRHLTFVKTRFEVSTNPDPSVRFTTSDWGYSTLNYDCSLNSCADYFINEQVNCILRVIFISLTAQTSSSVTPPILFPASSPCCSQQKQTYVLPYMHRLQTLSSAYTRVLKPQQKSRRMFNTCYSELHKSPLQSALVSKIPASICPHILYFKLEDSLSLAGASFLLPWRSAWWDKTVQTESKFVSWDNKDFIYMTVRWMQSKNKCILIWQACCSSNNLASASFNEEWRL